MRYSGLAYAANQGAVPSRAQRANFEGTDGNSQLHPSQFNPAQLIVSRTFHIKIYEREATNICEGELARPGADLGDVIFTLKNCRMSNYAIAFTPGSLVGENLGFMCIVAKDRVAESNVAAVQAEATPVQATA